MPLVPVDFDPFEEEGDNKLVPVDYDPFEEDTTPAPKQDRYAGLAAQAREAADDVDPDMWKPEIPKTQFGEGVKDVQRSSMTGLGITMRSFGEAAERGIGYNQREAQDLLDAPKSRRVMAARRAGLPLDKFEKRLRDVVATGEVEREAPLSKSVGRGLRSAGQRFIDVAQDPSAPWAYDPAMAPKTFLDKLVRTTPQIMGQVAAGVATGGLGSSAFMFTQIAGGEYENLTKQGVEHDRAVAASLVSAFAQTPMEAIGGVGRAHKLFKFKKAIVNKFKAISGHGFSEALTEFFQQYPSAAAELWAKNPDRNVLESIYEAVKDPKNFEEALESGAIGAIMGSGVSVTGVAASPEARKEADIAGLSEEDRKALKANPLLDIEDIKIKNKIEEVVAKEKAVAQTDNDIFSEFEEESPTVESDAGDKIKIASGSGLQAGLSEAQLKEIRAKQRAELNAKKRREQIRAETTNRELAALRINQEVDQKLLEEQQRLDEFNRARIKQFERQSFFADLEQPEGVIQKANELLGLLEDLGTPQQNSALQPIEKARKALYTGNYDLKKLFDLKDDIQRNFDSGKFNQSFLATDASGKPVVQDWKVKAVVENIHKLVNDAIRTEQFNEAQQARAEAQAELRKKAAPYEEETRAKEIQQRAEKQADIAKRAQLSQRVSDWRQKKKAAGKELAKKVGKPQVAMETTKRTVTTPAGKKITVAAPRFQRAKQQVKAALRIPGTGEILTGNSHAEIIENMSEAQLEEMVKVGFKVDEGFTGPEGFLSRKEAAEKYGAGKSFRFDRKSVAEVGQKVRAKHVADELTKSLLKVSGDIPKINVATSQKAAPKRVRDEIAKAKAENARALYDPESGEVWLFSDKLASMYDAKQAVWHEIGHELFRRTKEARVLVRNINVRDHADIRARLKMYGLQPTKKNQYREAEEILVEKFEAGSDLGLVNRVKSIFRRVGRKLGLSSEAMTDEDINHAISRMRQNLLREKVKSGKNKPGQKGTAFGNKIKWGIFELIKAAGGHGSVGDYLLRKQSFRDEPVTPAAATYAQTMANNMKDPKTAAEHKEIISIRTKIAMGKIVEGTPAYSQALKKFGSKLEGHSIRHRKRFFVAKKKVYGPKKASDTSKVASKIHRLTGEFKVTEYYDTAGNLVMDTPIFPLTKSTRAKQIDAIVAKNKQHVRWYEDWNDFIRQFEKRINSDTLDKFIKIQAVLSAGTGPQGNQKLFTEAANKLLAGKKLKPGKRSEGKDGISEPDAKKIERIWAGEDVEVNIDLRKLMYSNKVGAYMTAGLDPLNPEAIVIDRHMPRLWGYDITWSPNGKHDQFKVAPEVERIIVNDIKESAQRTGVSPAGVQAALWFASRTPDVEASDYREAARIKPSEYLPGVLYDATMPASMGMGVHYRGTTLQEGEFILPADRNGEIQHSTYSLSDIGNRIWAHTEKNPYAPLVYFYEAGTKPERQLAGKKNRYNIDLRKFRIYDGDKDPLHYMKTVMQRKKADPGASETNILANLLKNDYDGVLVRAPVGTGGRWILMFEKVAVEHVPVVTDVGISDMVESLESLPQSPSEAEKLVGKRGLDFYRKTKQVHTSYPEIELVGFDPTMAQFDIATSGALEIGASLKLRGPLPAVRSMVSELAIGNVQRQVYVMHTKGKPNGHLVKFKIRKDFKSVDQVREVLKKHGLDEFNIVVKHNTGSLFMEQYVWDDSVISTLESIFNEIGDPTFDFVFTLVNSEVLGYEAEEGGKELTPAEEADLAMDRFKDHIIHYLGEENGEKRFQQAQEKRQEHISRLSNREAEKAGLQRETSTEGLEPGNLQEVKKSPVQSGLSYARGHAQVDTSELIQADRKLRFDRRGSAPEKTIRAYKLFRTLKTKPGEIFPLFIGNTKSVPIGEWLEAEPIPTKGFAHRPGWHAGIMPRADHLSKKNRVWAEVEIPADVDWQPEANKNGRYSKKGRWIPGDIPDRIPKGGYYRFPVQANQGAEWIIGGSLKVNRLLTQKEVDQINAGELDITAEEFVKQIEDKLKPSKRDALIEDIKVAFNNNPYKELISATKGKGIKLRFVNKKADHNPQAIGSYDPSTNKISFYLPIVEWHRDGLQTLIAHESLHAFIRHEIYSDEKRARAFLSGLMDFYEDCVEVAQQQQSASFSYHVPEVPNRVTQILNYISENTANRLEELITYGFTDSTFANWLNSIPAKHSVNIRAIKKPTMWDRFKSIILEFVSPKLKTKVDELSALMDYVLNIPAVTPLNLAVDEKSVLGPDVAARFSRDSIKDELTPEQWEKIQKIGLQPRSMQEKMAGNLENLTDRIAHYIADPLYRLKKLQYLKGNVKPFEDAYMDFNMLGNFDSIFRSFLEDGRLMMSDNWVTSNPDDAGKGGLLTVFERLGKDSELFMLRMLGKSAAEMHRKGRENLFGKDLDDVETIKTLDNATRARYQKNREVWDEAEARLKEINQSVLDIMEATNIINPDTRQEWERENYIPFYRLADDFADGEIMALHPSFGPDVKSIKRLKGSKRHVADPMQNLLSGYAHFLHNSLKNMARVKAMKTLKHFDLIEKTSPQDKSKNVVDIRVKGKVQYFKVHDRLAFESIMHIDDASNGMFSKVLRAPKRWLTYAVTQNPAFKLANWFRDTLTVGTLEKEFIPIVDSVIGMMHELRNTNVAKEYRATGGAFMGAYHQRDILKSTEAGVKKLRRRVARGKRSGWNPLRWYELYNRLGEISENAARLGLYAKKRARGATAQEAGYSAMDLLNFNRSGKGKLVRAMVSTMPFLNARIQGLYKLGREGINTRKGRAHMANFYLMAGGIAFVSLLNHLWLDDDDRYDELRKDEKWNYYHIFDVPGLGHVRLPVPFEIGTFGKLAPVLWERFVQQRSTNEDVKAFAKFAITQMFSLDWPQVIKPLVQQVANKNFFTGVPIVPMSKKSLEPFLQVSPRTPAGAKGIGQVAKAMGLPEEFQSPLRIEAFFRDYFSYLSAVTFGLSDMAYKWAVNAPADPFLMDTVGYLTGFSRFVRGDKPSRRTKYEEKFYDLLTEADSVNKTYNALKKIRSPEARQRAREYRQEHKPVLRQYRRLRSVQERLKRLRTKEQLIIRSRKSRDQKVKEIQSLTRQRTQILKQALEQFEGRG